MVRPSTIANREDAQPESAFRLARSESEGFLRHFGFRETPFGVTPDPEFLFWSSMHRSAFHGIVRSIESNLGFSVLIGDPGTGKTTLLFQLLTQYRGRARTAFVFQTQCRPHDLLRHIASELELPCTRRDEVLLHQGLKAMLIQEARAGRKVVIIVDEAQNLQPSSLEAIRLLSDFETAPCKLLHVVLAGSSRLRETLLSPDLSQLAQRITTVCQLGPLTDLEVERYVKFRLGVAGDEPLDELFSGQALMELAFQSRGVPRLVNAIASRALVLAYRSREQSITGERIKEAAKDIDLAESHRSLSTDFPEEAFSLPPVMPDEDNRAKHLHKQEPTSDRYASETQLPKTDIPSGFAESAPLPLAHLKNSGRVQLHSNPDSQISIPAVSGVKGSWRSYRSVALFAVLCLLLTLSSRVAWNGLHAKPKADSESSDQSAEPASASNARSAASIATGNVVQDSLAKSNAATVPLPAPGNTQHDVTSQHAAPVVNMLSDSLLRSRIDTRLLNSAESTAPSSLESVSAASNTTAPPLDTHSSLPRLETPEPVNKSNAPHLTVPRLVKFVKPEYPDKALLWHIEGPVQLEIAIDRDGTVTTVRPLSGNPILIQAAELAVQQWHYSPSTREQMPVAAVTQVGFDFKLNPEAKK